MTVQPDIATLFAATAVLQLCATILMFFLWRVHKAEAIRCWCLGFFCSALSALLVGLESTVAPVYPLYLSTILVVLGGSYFYFGIAKFLEVEIKWSLLIPGYVAATGLIVYYAVADSQLGILNLGYSIAGCIIYLLIFYELIRATPSGGRRGVYRLVGITYLVLAIATIKRCEFMLAHSDATLFSYGPAQYLWLIVVQATTYISALGCLLMINQQIMQRLDQSTTTDPLTGLSNRRVLRKAIAKIVADPNEQSCHALAFFDFDHFKEINDRYGHDIGDQVLVTVTRELAKLIRPPRMIIRSGGDEFWVLMPNTSLEEATEIAHAMCRAADATEIDTNSVIIHPTISVGLTSFKKADIVNGGAKIFNDADAAMYQVKKMGGGTVCPGP